MCSPFFFQGRKNKLRSFEIYTCQNTVVAQSKLHPAFDNGVRIQDTTAIFLQDRRVKWQKDKLVIQNRSQVLFPTS